MPSRAARGWFLSVMAVVFAILALSNATKALQFIANPLLGIVIFGVRFDTFASNLILGPVMGAVLAAYAYGVWTMRRWVLPLSMAYAFFVPLNLVLFWYRQTGPEIPPLLSIVSYLAVALGGSIGTALYLTFHRDRLG